MSSQVKTDGLPKKWVMLGVIALLLLVGQSEGYAIASSYFPDPSLKVSVENQHISAQIHHMSLQAVLSTLSTQLPVQFILQGIDQDILISASFSNLPFEQGLERLLSGYDYAIIHASMDESRSTDASPTMKEVMIFSRSSPTDPPSSSNKPPVIIAPAVLGQPHIKNLQEEPHTEDDSRLSDTTTQDGEQGLESLLHQTLGETDPETPQLVQEILNHLELGKE